MNNFVDGPYVRVQVFLLGKKGLNLLYLWVQTILTTIYYQITLQNSLQQFSPHLNQTLVRVNFLIFANKKW